MKKWILILPALLCAVGSAYAENKLSVTAISGVEADTRRQSFSNVGAVADYTLQGRWRLTALLMASQLYYRFPIGTTIIKANSPGAHYLGGFKHVCSDRSYIALLAGGVSRDTEFTGGASAQFRADTGASYMADLQAGLPARFVLNLLGVFNDNDEYGWSRVTLKKQINNFNYQNLWTVHAGAVGTFQGNTQHEAQMGGGLLEAYYLPWKASVSLQGGYKWDASWGKANYGGLNLSKQF